MTLCLTYSTTFASSKLKIHSLKSPSLTVISTDDADEISNQTPTLSIVAHNNFMSVTNLSTFNETSPLVVLFLGVGDVYSDLYSDDLNTYLSDLELEITQDALFYPNPFRLDDGSTIGYRLNKSANVELRIYDLQGMEIFSTLFESELGYNKEVFDKDLLGHSELPAGVYFYLMLDEDESILGKGKFAVLP